MIDHWEESNAGTEPYPDLLCMPNSNKIFFKTPVPIYSLYTLFFSTWHAKSPELLRNTYNREVFQQLHCSFLQFQQAHTYALPTSKFAFREWVFSSAGGTDLIYVNVFIYIIQSEIPLALGNNGFRIANLIVGLLEWENELYIVEKRFRLYTFLSDSGDVVCHVVKLGCLGNRRECVLKHTFNLLRIWRAK